MGALFGFNFKLGARMLRRLSLAARESRRTVVCLAPLLAAAVALRVYTLVAYFPAVLSSKAHDGAAYIRPARTKLSEGLLEPLGYPLFLRAVHTISHQLAFTIAIQHLLGVLAGLLLFCAMRRLSAPIWIALVPAIVLWFGGDQLFLEHAPLSEGVFVPLVAAAVYAGARALSGERRWAVVTGALAASLLTVRTVATPIPVVVVIWLAVALWRLGLPWRRLAAFSLAGTAAVLCAYALVWHEASGAWAITPEGAGWNLYAMAAQFANCHDFTPPQGTRVLCERIPPSRRQGADWYLWLGGPANAAFGGDPSHDQQVGAFSEQAILNQPLDYMKLVGIDLIQYLDPGFDERPNDGGVYPQSAVFFPAGTPALDPATRRQVSAYYGPVARPTGTPAHRLYEYQRVFRLSGWMLLALLLVALLGAIAAAGRVRWAMLLMVALALELVFVPALTQVSWRYAVPTEGPLAASAALGVWSLWRWMQATLRRTRSIDASSPAAHAS
jgi:hypothetical protein